MNIFDRCFDDVRQILTSGDLKNHTEIFSFNPESTWARGKPGDLILSSDTAIELGHPQTESIAFLMWSDSADRVNDGRITIVGPDLDKMVHDKGPFGRIILVGVHGFTEDNAYDRFQEMDMVRMKLGLKGYMLRAVPQKNREWSRISKQGLRQGLSLTRIGNELIREYRKLDYVDAAEVIFMTSFTEVIRKFRPVSENVAQITRAMNRIYDNLELDCDDCGFKAVCDEAEGLRSMHKQAREKNARA
jgi:CO dehydrogenase/acetyl-CoA synthase beta subunit